MKNKSLISWLVLFIVAFATLATTRGIFSNEGTGAYDYRSIRGKTVTVYGNGVYKHMSAEVAPQGIAQDYVTLFIATPLLIFALWSARKGSQKGKFLLAGTLGYFLVTYLFYTAMAMYNDLFLAYVALLCTSFYAFLLTILSFNLSSINTLFKTATPVKATGGFLIFSSVSIALLWLSIVVPPLFDGSIIPLQVEHYTTLIVQGLDLGILLPAAFICAVLWIKKKALGYLLAPVYFIFLSLLMTALTAKVIAMAILGYSVVPVIFIIPTFNLISLLCMIVILKNVNEFPLSANAIHHKQIVFT